MYSLLIKCFSIIAQNRRFSFNNVLLNLCKILAISALAVLISFTFLDNIRNYKPYDLVFTTQKWTSPQALNTVTPTNISHIVFGISGSIKSWTWRKNYVESWWKPNVTRGYLFLDKNPENVPWPSSSPPFIVSEDTTKFQVYAKHVAPSVIRIVRAILEVYRAEDENKNVRWFVMGDDDTIFFLENLVKVLQKYDHTKYYYIGGVSESTKSNYDFSFEMAFGGGGFALSRPLAAVLVTNLDYCIERYWKYYTSDHILQSCIADIGVSLTPAKGFHQIDLHHDISGLLSAHPQSPIVSLHHLDLVLPLFPSKSRYNSVMQLMKPANAGCQSRLLQQTICYDRQNNWSYSISWGYSAYVYEQILPRSVLKRPLETFSPWKERSRAPAYVFDTRPLYKSDSCEAPHVFFFETLNFTTDNKIVTRYDRSLTRGLPACALGGNHSADHVTKIEVLSPIVIEDENVIECCEVEQVVYMNTTRVRFRRCMMDEIVG